MDPILASVTLFAGNFAPKSWALCQGQLLAISQNTALFSLVGVTYGGDGRVTFALPDLRGRAVVGVGQMIGGSTYDPGQMEGTETTTLNISQMAAHVHSASVTISPSASTNAGTSSPSGAVYANTTENLYNPTADSSMAPYPATLTTGATGKNLPFSNLHPVLGMNYIICMQGVYPQRS